MCFKKNYSGFRVGKSLQGARTAAGGLLTSATGERENEGGLDSNDGVEVVMRG